MTLVRRASGVERSGSGSGMQWGVTIFFLGRDGTKRTTNSDHTVTNNCGRNFSIYRSYRPSVTLLNYFSIAELHCVSLLYLEQLDPVLAMRLFDGLELPASADFHVHLRDGDMMKAVTPTIRKGGVDTVYVYVCCVLWW